MSGAATIRWQRDNPERARAVQARYRKTEKARARSRKYEEAHRERRRAAKRAAYALTKDQPTLRDKNRQRAKAWYWKNRERAILAARSWAGRHPELARARYKKWAMKNREHVRLYGRDQARRYKNEVTEAYATYLLTNGRSNKRGTYPASFIAAKRQHLRNRRLLRRLSP